MSPITLDPLEISVPKPNISIFFTVTETPYALSKKLKLRLVREYRLIPTSLILRKGSNRSSTVWGLNESVLWGLNESVLVCTFYFAGQQMGEISSFTFTYEAFPEAMGMLWKRMFHDNRQVDKSSKS